VKQIIKIVTWKREGHYELPKKGISIKSLNSSSVVAVLLFVSIAATALLSSFYFPYQSTLAFKALESGSSQNSNGGQTAIDGGFLTYESPSLGIRIQYPSNMSLSEDKRDDGTVYRASFVSMPYLTEFDIQVISASAFSRNGSFKTENGTMSLNSNHNNANMTMPLDQIANTILELQKQSDPGTQIGGISQPAIISPTIQTIQFNYTQTSSRGMVLDHSIYLIKHNDNVVHADYSRPSTHEKLYPTFINMLNTLEFIR
jgi:hypothetical protein